VQLALTLTLVGMVVVFAVLLALTAMIAIVRWLDLRPTPPAVLPGPEPEEPTLDDEIVVVIAAAVAAVVAGPHRIQQIRRIPPSQDSGLWSEAGRAEVHASHRTPGVRKDP
jgi:Na+-transporting methylmalonyl-CoA/oxaloacetate decarboxylase gamma subunit